MDITVERKEKPIAVVTFKGRLDLITAAEAKQALTSSVAEGYHQLVVSLSEVEFVDSSGLGALVGGLKAARVVGGDLRIAQPGEQVQYILKISTLERVLRPYATVEEALSGY